MKPLKAGVIGVGHLGQHHARLYAELPQTQLTAIADIDPDRARQIGHRHHVPFYTDFSSFLKNVELVSIAVPTTSHYHVAKACLEAGLHILVEKPIAATVAEAQELVALAAAKGCVLQVGHVERFNPIILKAHAFIVNPEFIECQRLSPFGNRGIDVDVVLDLMIHDLDLLTSMNLGPVDDVSATGVAVLSPHIDFANARITFQRGGVANLTASRVSPSRVRKLQVFQRDDYMTLDLHAKRGILSRRIRRHETPSRVETESMSCEGHDEPLRLQIEDFLRAVITGSPPRVTGSEASVTLALAARVQEAIDNYLTRYRRPAQRLVPQALQQRSNKA